VIRHRVLAASLACATVCAAVTATVALATQAQGAAAVPRARHAAGLRVPPLSGAALATAAGHCAAWAANAGFANNGYLGGSLTTAVAVALAESGCNPSACFDNTTGKNCTPPGPPADSVDRGAWQLNSKVPGATSNKCAFNGPCSATAAYRVESQDGTFFAAWVRYQTDDYAGFLPAAQSAVNALRAGTVTSGEIGSCLSYPSDRSGARVILANCGTAAADQIWRIRGAAVRTGRGLCLTAGSRHPGAVLLGRCGRSPRHLRLAQRWLAHGDDSLYSPGARRCLTDPRAADKPGAVIGLARCTGARDQTWWLP
jgi:Lysozyme like domain/Ricin-type beta-trefoil lectin domain